MTLRTAACQALCVWDSLGKNTGVGCHALLQGIYLIWGLLAGVFLTTSATWKAPSLYHLEFIHGLNMFSLVLLSFKNYFNF